MKKLAAICILFLTTSCALLPSPELTWDHDPETRIIEIFTDSGGSAPNTALIT